MIRPGVVVLTGEGSTRISSGQNPFLPRYRLERACESKILRCVVNEIISSREAPRESNPLRSSRRPEGKSNAIHGCSFVCIGTIVWLPSAQAPSLMI
jgi:hypothetical protein